MMIDSLFAVMPDWLFDIYIEHWVIAKQEKYFPWWYEQRMHARHAEDMVEKFGYVPQVGDMVEDCRGEVHEITHVFPDPDEIALGDFHCSLWHCCDLPPGFDRGQRSITETEKREAL